MSAVDADPDSLRAWREAVDQALNDVERSRSWLAEAIGFSNRQRLNAMFEADAKPPPAAVALAIDRALHLEGSTAMTTLPLGYVPADWRGPDTFIDFVKADPSLKRSDRAALLALYNTLVEHVGSRHR